MQVRTVVHTEERPGRMEQVRRSVYKVHSPLQCLACLHRCWCIGLNPEMIIGTAGKFDAINKAGLSCNIGGQVGRSIGERE